MDVTPVGPALRGPVLRADLLPLPGAPREARGLVTAACLCWDALEVAGGACTAASELVANGVVHAGTMMTLRVSRTAGLLRVEVEDGGVGVPRLDPLRRISGLRLVAEFATSWGWRRIAGGKITWATFALAGA